MFTRSRTTSTTVPVEAYLQRNGLSGKRLTGGLAVAIDFAQSHGFFWLINVNAVFIQCRKPISSGHVMTALQKLMQRHPHMRMRITVGDTQKEKYVTYFDTDPEPNFDLLETDDWMAIVHEQFNVSFPANKLQWRVKMLAPSEDKESDKWRHGFVFAFNHALFDGGSIIAGVIKDFHHYLEEAVTGRDREVESHALLPGRETLFPKVKPDIFDKLVYKVKGIFQGAPFGSDEVATKLIPSIRPQTLTNKATKIIAIDLSADETSRIIRKCKDQGIKVNGYVSAAAAVATAKLVHEHGPSSLEATEAMQFHSAFMVNLRRFANPPIDPEKLGFLNSIIPYDIKVPGNWNEEHAFWDLAKWHHEFVSEVVARGVHYKQANYVNYFFENTQDLGAMFGHVAEEEAPMYLYYMTNRGNFKIDSQFPDEEGSCTFDGDYWAAAEHTLNVSVFVHSLQTVNGRMMWTLTYYAHKCTDEIAKSHVEDIRDTLLRMAPDTTEEKEEVY